MVRRKPLKRTARRVHKPSSAGKPDYTLLIILLFLLGFGIVMIFDASVVFAHEQFGDKYLFVKQQIVWIVIGLVLGLAALNIPYHYYRKFALPMMFVTIFLLILVFVPGVGVEANGSHRCINIGIGTLQPSELAKLTFTVYLAAILSKTRQISQTSKLNEAFKEHFKKDLLPFLVILGVVSVLVILEPDLGSTIIIGLTSMSVYFISGTSSIHSIGAVLTVLVTTMSGVLAAVVSPYRLERIRTFIPLLLKGEVEDPLGAGYQIQQILIAIGSGGVLGLGFGESRQKFLYLVETKAVTDSVFAVIAEELGLIGSIIILSIFGLLIYRGIMIARNSVDKFGALIATGITFWLGAQAVLNIAANVAIMPLTGIPLPFISYGGSALVIELVAMGILLNISRYRVKDG